LEEFPPQNTRTAEGRGWSHATARSAANGNTPKFPMVEENLTGLQDRPDEEIKILSIL
jgi:hypothetical protein